MNGVVVFAYHNMGLMALRALIDSGVNIHLVVTHKDNPNENIWFHSVAKLCKEKNIKFIYAEDFSIKEMNEIFCDYDISVIFSIYYRNLLPTSLLKKARYGAVNMHGSYLPKYRGRVPVNWQIINGEKESGVTLHYMIDKPDAGDIIDQTQVGITLYDTPVTLFAKLEKAGKKILNRSLNGILNGTCDRVPQDHTKATYYGGRKPEDGKIDWSWVSERIYNFIRGVTKPYPGAFSYIKDNKIIIWKASIKNLKEIDKKFIPGMVIVDKDQVYVGTGDGLIQLNKIHVNDKDYVYFNSIDLLQNGNRFTLN